LQHAFSLGEILPSDSLLIGFFSPFELRLVSEAHRRRLTNLLQFLFPNFCADTSFDRREPCNYVIYQTDLLHSEHPQFSSILRPEAFPLLHVALLTPSPAGAFYEFSVQPHFPIKGVFFQTIFVSFDGLFVPPPTNSLSPGPPLFSVVPFTLGPVCGFHPPKVRVPLFLLRRQNDAARGTHLSLLSDRIVFFAI